LGTQAYPALVVGTHQAVVGHLVLLGFLRQRSLVVESVGDMVRLDALYQLDSRVSNVSSNNQIYDVRVRTCKAKGRWWKSSSSSWWGNHPWHRRWHSWHPRHPRNRHSWRWNRWHPRHPRHRHSWHRWHSHRSSRWWNSSTGKSHRHAWGLTFRTVCVGDGVNYRLCLLMTNFYIFPLSVQIRRLS